MEKEKKKSIAKKINIIDAIRQSIIQIKYEEIGAWLATHNTPLFYVHKDGFTLVDRKFIDSRPWLKKALDKLIKEVAKKKPLITPKPVIAKKQEKVEYIA